LIACAGCAQVPAWCQEHPKAVCISIIAASTVEMTLFMPDLLVLSPRHYPYIDRSDKELLPLLSIVPPFLAE